jgi:hypothetical protein
MIGCENFCYEAVLDVVDSRFLQLVDVSVL